jgi:hypothetical protein
MTKNLNLKRVVKFEELIDEAEYLINDNGEWLFGEWDADENEFVIYQPGTSSGIITIRYLVDQKCVIFKLPEEL